MAWHDYTRSYGSNTRRNTFVARFGSSGGLYIAPVFCAKRKVSPVPCSSYLLAALAGETAGGPLLEMLMEVEISAAAGDLAVVVEILAGDLAVAVEVPAATGNSVAVEGEISAVVGGRKFL